MGCNEYQLALSELVDGVLAREAKARLESHHEECADCRALLADLRQIRATARALPKMTAPESVWQKVQADFDAEVNRSRRAPVLRFAPRRRMLLGGLAAAAVLVLAVSAGVFFMTRPSPTATPAPATAAAAQAAPIAPAAPTTPAAAHANAANAVQSIEADLELADQYYQKAIAGLETVAKEGQSALDPQVAAVLQKNIGVVDHAIVESRAALRSQPASEVARASLFEALQRKVGLLRDTIALINEMRKGDQAAAARIAGSLSKG
jgi:anti-sigma factor RsiW